MGQECHRKTELPFPLYVYCPANFSKINGAQSHFSNYSSHCAASAFKGNICRDRPPGGSVKIATFNINDINKRLENLLTWLAKTTPDVVSLQELKAGRGSF